MTMVLMPVASGVARSYNSRIRNGASSFSSWARSRRGDSPLDLLSEVYGWLVPFEFVAGAIAAWIATR